MLAAVRNLSKSKWGLAIIVAFLIAIAGSFALADVSSTLNGLGGQLPDQTLAKVGDAELSEREFNAELQRRLLEARQENPSATLQDLAGQFDPILNMMIQQKALFAFATGHGVVVSKRLVDAEIAKLPGARGLDGRFSEAAYAGFLNSIGMSDAEVRTQIENGILNRMMLVPVTANPSMPVGVARPYAAMQLEVREADFSLIPTAAFLAKVGNPTDAQLQAFYRENQARYMVPEQRVFQFATIGNENVAKVVPTEKQIADYYKANQAKYAAKSQRVISQVVVQSKPQADALAAKLRSGTSFVDAAQPLGFAAADISVGPQTRDQFAGLTSAAVANAAFANNVGANAVVGPVRSDLGWHVVKIDGIQEQPGKTLDQARSEIVTALTADLQKDALADLVNKVDEDIQEGSSFRDAIRAAGLESIRTPAITAGGRSRTDSSYTLDPKFAGALRTGFDMDVDEEPVVEPLPGDQGYVVVAVEEVMEAAPAPLAQIREQVVTDWKNKQARDMARKAASTVANNVAKGGTLGEALKNANAGVALPPAESATIRRIQLVQMQGQVPPAISMMFSLAEGRSRMVADPEGRGFVVVKLKKVTPGDVTLQPGLISQIQKDFREAISNEYAEQFVKAVEKDIGSKRNDEAIANARRRIMGGSGS